MEKFLWICKVSRKVWREFFPRVEYIAKGIKFKCTRLKTYSQVRVFLQCYFFGKQAMNLVVWSKTSLKHWDKFVEINGRKKVGANQICSLCMSISLVIAVSALPRARCVAVVKVKARDYLTGSVFNLPTLSGKIIDKFLIQFRCSQSSSYCNPFEN